MMRGGVDSSPSRPIFAVTRVKYDRECFNYGDIGHSIRDCPKLFRASGGRGSNRGALRGGRGRGGRGDHRGNVVGTQGEFSKANYTSLVELERQDR